MKSLEVSEEKANQRVEEFKRQLKSLTGKLKEAENRAELAEKTVKKLQKEVDRLEGMFLELCQTFTHTYKIFISFGSKSKQNEEEFSSKKMRQKKKFMQNLFLSLKNFSNFLFLSSQQNIRKLIFPFCLNLELILINA